MLEKPDIADKLIVECLRRDYGLRITDLEFLPLGADADTAVYRAVAEDGTPYFVKLRGGDFDELTIIVPHYLETQGIPHLIAPIETRAGQLWTRLDRFAVILSPFIAGRNGFDVPLRDREWIDLGRTLRGVHTVQLPDEIDAYLRCETFSPYWRERVRAYQRYLGTQTFSDLVSAHLAELMRSQEDVIDELVRRAESLGRELQAQSLDFVLCHADIHAGNVLLDEDGELYVVDWDTLILAPKERDLMFIGAGIGRRWNTQRESDLFYQGYGPAEVDPAAIAYYRYERIVEDIAAYCQEILESEPGNRDRQKGLHRLSAQFLPNDVVEIAFATDRTSRAQ
jgi:spectinomycin phosphotransferase